VAEGDSERWNVRWTERKPHTEHSSSLIELVKPWLPADGRALDVAGGGSGDAVRLAQAGLDVTVVDVSEVALELAQKLADAAPATITTVQADLEVQPIPAGPWDVITLGNFLNRPLFPSLLAALATDGIIAVVLATRLNLERHSRPAQRYLLEPGELLDLVDGLDVVHHSEEWRENSRHEAWLVARQR